MVIGRMKACEYGFDMVEGKTPDRFVGDDVDMIVPGRYEVIVEGLYIDTGCQEYDNQQDETLGQAARRCLAGDCTALGVVGNRFMQFGGAHGSGVP